MSTDDGRSDPPVTSASILALTIARKVEAELAAALAPLDLTVSRLGLLGHISGVPGASFSDLARMSSISVQSVHTAVKALVNAGLVRDRTARAGSASTIELTPKGARLLRSAREAIAEVDAKLFGPESDPILQRAGKALVDAFTGETPS
ncbi:MarR family winged helix-turn-helix transcriptional regulator [Nocardia mexicana]|nr:MarR family winged helix-turn-helix transcriptional regulator [Nocardia mexicana]